MSDYDLGERFKGTLKTLGIVAGVSVIFLLAVFVPMVNGWKQPQRIDIAFGSVVDEGHNHKRSAEWPAVRAEHLKNHPVCEACGGKKGLQAHHIIPFHGHPELELEPSNLITLCTDGPCNLNCHFVWGHLGNTRCSNPNVRQDAAYFLDRLEHRPCE